MSIRDLITQMPEVQVENGVVVNAKAMLQAALEKQGVTQESYLAFQEAAKRAIGKITTAGTAMVRTIVNHQMGKIITTKIKKGPGRNRTLRVRGKYAVLLDKAPTDWALATPVFGPRGPQGIDTDLFKRPINAEFLDPN